MTRPGAVGWGSASCCSAVSSQQWSGSPSLPDPGGILGFDWKRKKPAPVLFWGVSGVLKAMGLGVCRRQLHVCSPFSAFICSWPSRVMQGARSLHTSQDVKCSAALLVALGSLSQLCRHCSFGGHGTAGGHGAAGSGSLLGPRQHEAGSARSPAGLPSAAGALAGGSCCPHRVPSPC